MILEKPRGRTPAVLPGTKKTEGTQPLGFLRGTIAMTSPGIELISAAQCSEEQFLRQIFVRDQMAEWSKDPLLMARAEGVPQHLGGGGVEGVETFSATEAIQSVAFSIDKGVVAVVASQIVIAGAADERVVAGGPQDAIIASAHIN